MVATGQQLRLLRDAILGAVTDQADLERIVQDNLNVRLKDHVEDGPLEKVVADWLNWLIARGRLLEFTSALRQERAANVKLILDLDTFDQNLASSQSDEARKERIRVARERFSLLRCKRVGLRLLTVIEGETVPAKDVLRCYYAAVPAEWLLQPPSDSEEAIIFVAYSITLSQEHAKRTQPLKRFAQVLSAYFDEKRRPSGKAKVVAWWRETAAELNLGDGDLTSREDSKGQFSVLIEIIRANDSPVHQPLLQTRAWLYTHRGDDSAEPMYVPLDADKLNDVQTPETISVYLTELRRRLAKRGVPAERTIFEFFLPQELLAFAIDQWSVQVGAAKSRIGHESQVVIRLLDRPFETRDKVKIQTRWNRLHKSKKLSLSTRYNGRGDADTALECSVEGNIDDLYRDYDVAPKLLCLLITEPLVIREDFQKIACLWAAIAAGVPFIIWPRSAAAAEALKSQARKWLRKPPLEAPRNIHDFRRNCPAGDPSHLGRNVTLFFENAEYWVPDDEPLTEI